MTLIRIYDGVFQQKLVKGKAPPLLFNRAVLNMPLKHKITFENCTKLATRENDVNDLLLVLFVFSEHFFGAPLFESNQLRISICTVHSKIKKFLLSLITHPLCYFLNFPICGLAYFTSMFPRILEIIETKKSIGRKTVEHVFIYLTGKNFKKYQVNKLFYKNYL